MVNPIIFRQYFFPEVSNTEARGVLTLIDSQKICELYLPNVAAKDTSQVERVNRLAQYLEFACNQYEVDLDARSIVEIEVSMIGSSFRMNGKVVYTDDRETKIFVLTKVADELNADMEVRLLAITQRAHAEYSKRMPDIHRDLSFILGCPVIGRAKDPVSAANRIRRALSAHWAEPRLVADINSVLHVVKNLWDAIGSRIVLPRGSEDEIASLVGHIQSSISSGVLVIRELNNLRGDRGLPYFSDSQIQAIQQACEARLLKVKIGNIEKTGSAFTSVCVYVDHGQDLTGELQVIGPEVLKISVVEHFPYDVSLGKDLYRGLSLNGREYIQTDFDSFIRAVKSLREDLKHDYEMYLNTCYICARQFELTGVKQDAPFPSSISAELAQLLTVEAMMRMHEKYEHAKTL